MFSKRAGRFSLNINYDVSENPYCTFTPHPLCRDVSLSIDDELLTLLVNAHRQLGLLEGSCKYARDKENINRLFLLKEVATSYSIDDNLHFSYQELFGILGRKKREQRIAPIKNHIEALEYGISELDHARLTNKLIYNTHDVLMGHKRSIEIIGSVRKKQAILGDIMVSVANMETYNPTEPEEIKACIADVQEYIRRKDPIDPLVKAAMLHYQLEAIHPFESGNGRIGRILIALYLFETGLLRHTLLPISEFLLMDKVEYFDRLNAIHYWGRYEQWIKFFLKILEAASSTTFRRVEAALKLRELNVSAIKAEDKDVKHLLDAYAQVEKHIFLNTASLAEAIGVSYNTGARIMGNLVGKGIMKLLKYKERNRIYFYAGFLEAVEIIISKA